MSSTLAAYETGLLGMFSVQPNVRKSNVSRGRLHNFSCLLIAALIVHHAVVAIFMPKGFAVYSACPGEWFSALAAGVLGIVTANHHGVTISQANNVFIAVIYVPILLMLPKIIISEKDCGALHPDQLANASACLHANVETASTSAGVRDTCALSGSATHWFFDTCPTILYGASMAAFWVWFTVAIMVVMWVFLPIMCYYSCDVSRQEMQRAMDHRQGVTMSASKRSETSQ